jgi:hypothetical protein
MVVAASPENAELAGKLWQEAREFVLILESIHRKSTAATK